MFELIPVKRIYFCRFQNPFTDFSPFCGFRETHPIFFYCVAMANRAHSAPEESSHFFALKSLTFKHSSDSGPKVFVTTQNKSASRFSGQETLSYFKTLRKFVVKKDGNYWARGRESNVDFTTQAASALNLQRPSWPWRVNSGFCD